MTSESLEDSMIAQLGNQLQGHQATSSSAANESEKTEATEPEPHYGFDLDFQERIVALSLIDSGFMRRTDGLIKPDYFESQVHAELVSLAQDYFRTYRGLPSRMSVWKQVLRDAIDSRRLRRDMLQPVIEKLRQLIKSNCTDRDYVIGKVSEFAKSQAVNKAMFRSAELIGEGKLEEAQQILQKAFGTGATDDLIHVDYWNNIDNRTEYRRDLAAGNIKRNGVTTGIAQIDAILYHRGWGRCELSALMGGAKKGKSTALGEFGLRAAMHGHNVIYFTLEVAGRIIEDRLDANITSTSMQELELHLNSIEQKVKSHQSNANVGQFRLVQGPSGAMRPSDIRRILERYKGEGILFDLIIVDYADIMAPEVYVQDTIENSRQIWLALRAIAFEYDAAVLTATQTNREGFKATTAKAEHAADDFNKIRTADLVISINREEDERQRGEARLYFAASRNQAGEFCVVIKQDLDKMKFITQVLKVN